MPNEFPYFGGELTQSQLQELLRKADRSFHFQPPLRADVSGNQVFVTLDQQVNRRCFVRSGPPNEPNPDCPGCVVSSPAHPVFFDRTDGELKVKCCETVQVFFPFLNEDELCAVQVVDCPDPNEQPELCDFSLNDCDSGNCGDTGCQVFCAELRNGRWEADYRPNRIVCGTVTNTFGSLGCDPPEPASPFTIPNGGAGCVTPEASTGLALITNVNNCGEELNEGDRVIAFQDICCTWQMFGLSRQETDTSELLKCLCALRDIVQDNVDDGNLTVTPEQQTLLDNCPCSNDGDCNFCPDIPNSFTLEVKNANVASPVLMTASPAVLQQVEATMDAACLQTILDALSASMTLVPGQDCLWAGEIEVTCDLLVDNSPGFLPATGAPGTYTFTFRFGAQVDVDLSGNYFADFSLSDVTSTFPGNPPFNGFQADFRTNTTFGVQTIPCGTQDPAVAAVGPQNDFDITAARLCLVY